MEKLIFRFDEKKLAGSYSPEIKKVLMYKKWTKPQRKSRVLVDQGSIGKSKRGR